jgi:hypothetical protein
MEVNPLLPCTISTNSISFMQVHTLGMSRKNLMVLICKCKRNSGTSNREVSVKKWEYHVYHMQKTLLFELGQMTCKNHFRTVRVSSWSVFLPRAPCLDYLICVLCFMLWIVTKFLEQLQCLYFSSIYYFFHMVGTMRFIVRKKEKSSLFVSVSHLLCIYAFCKESAFPDLAQSLQMNWTSWK